MLSRLNELDLCGLFLKLNNSLGQVAIQSKKVCTSPTRLYVRAFQSCQGVWQYLWVFRVIIEVFVEQPLALPGSADDKGLLKTSKWPYFHNY